VNAGGDGRLLLIDGVEAAMEGRERLVAPAQGGRQLVAVRSLAHVSGVSATPTLVSETLVNVSEVASLPSTEGTRDSCV
jgi:hypothetical protein